MSVALSRVVAALALALFTLSVAACGGGGGGGKNEVKYAQVQAGDMPEGADWTGVYYSEVYGYLHLTKEGKTVSGVWKTAGGTWGQMHGEVTGDLFKFEWEEHKIGGVGPGSKTEGRGYFKYFRPEGELVSDELKGEWGLGQSEAGNSWTATKQRNMDPDPNSILEEVGAAGRQTTGSEWDTKAPPPPSAGGADDGDSVGIDDESSEEGN